MKPEEQRIAIAKVIPELRWEVVTDHSERWVWPSGTVTGPPDDDLNAMHEAEKILSYKQHCFYCDALEMVVGGPAYMPAVRATAAQRAEAFLRTLNLWTDDT